MNLKFETISLSSTVSILGKVALYLLFKKYWLFFASIIFKKHKWIIIEVLFSKKFEKKNISLS